ncbi:helix-turn-helix domain-containing protein [Micromonospora aurantiaca (nom. illeg.)]|uniref:helix-turn-helix domain-containing protein n=1 Tax=Micromonospora aurantiaca (nom. illeg.) TaxID=47850 RepID=UPI001656F88B|nr:helix-turn-helix transcriptional regulator [Micromonospora aurantiaca]MBC9000469.1 helix-turn-helix transcriptional regulator [Micromonospora aurantiaca]
MHGDLYSYRRHGCRCPDARRARGIDSARYRRSRGTEPAPETVRAARYVRMLRQLLDGRTQRDLADRLGWSTSRLSAVLRAERIQEPTAERIAELHSILLRGRPLARRRWAPFDPEVVERAAAGEVAWSDLNAEHRQAVVAKLRGEGLGLEEVGARLRVSGQVVKNWSARARSVAGQAA